ncbi:hypothetical protein BHM03_00020638 [Ensete ventricosum]|nr:hypothetical protein BHM03_00020638 [Ensete ventricosum]
MSSCGGPKIKSELRVFESPDELATDLAEYISQLSENSVKERGCFTIALSGGSLISLMGKLCEAPYDKTVDWTKWFVFWADERAVAKNHIDSNYKLTKDLFLSKVCSQFGLFCCLNTGQDTDPCSSLDYSLVPILNSHVFSINDNVTVEDAAAEYEFAIRQLVKIRTVGVSESNDCPKFDLILLGMGPDGHVASLFPHHPALELKEEWVTYITDSPKPPPERITFTLPVINSASSVAMVAVGEEKAMAVHLATAGAGENFDASSLPARMVQPTDGKLVWFLDSTAASVLDVSNSGSG